MNTTGALLAQGIVHQCLQQDDMHNGDHGSYDTLIQDQMVMLYECILEGPYTQRLSIVPSCSEQQKNSPAVPEQTTVETVMNMTPENRAHFELEKEAIHLILNRKGD
ncbi:hypothetical protein Tco_0793786 [Tanacetum coccineum]